MNDDRAEPASPAGPPGSGSGGCFSYFIGGILGLITGAIASVAMISLNGELLGASESGCAGVPWAAAIVDLLVVAVLAALAWHVFFRIRRSSETVQLLRGTLATTLAILLLPWPCGAYYGVMLALQGCRTHG